MPTRAALTKLRPRPWAQVGLNGQKLSLTDRCLLSLARALLSSVDLLLVCNALDVLDLDVARNALEVR